LTRKHQEGNPVQCFSDLISIICNENVISSQTLEDILCDLNISNLSLQDGVEKCLCMHDDNFELAVSAFLSTRTLAVAAAKQVDPEWPSDESRENSIKRMLFKLGFPIHADNPRPIGAIQILKRLNVMYYNFIADKSGGYITPSNLRSIPLDAWAYVEHLIRITIEFYEVFCGMHVSLNKLFQKAKKARSLGPLFIAMQELDNGFRDLPIEQRKQNERELHRKTPFAGFSFDKYLESNMIKNYRNFFAHSEIELVETVGSDRVEKGLQSIIGLVKELQNTGIAPNVISQLPSEKTDMEETLYGMLKNLMPMKNRKRGVNI
jgi:hypothetical protein